MLNYKLSEVNLSFLSEKYKVENKIIHRMKLPEMDYFRLKTQKFTLFNTGQRLDAKNLITVSLLR